MRLMILLILAGCGGPTAHGTLIRCVQTEPLERCRGYIDGVVDGRVDAATHLNDHGPPCGRWPETGAPDWRDLDDYGAGYWHGYGHAFHGRLIEAREKGCADQWSEVGR